MNDAKGHRRWYWSLWTISLLVLLFPVLSTEHLPLVDYPNHLSRTFILTHFKDCFFGSWFVRSNRPTPNLAVDATVTTLQQIVGLTNAGRAFVAITIVVFAIGTHCLSKAILRRTRWPAIATAFLVYNSMLLYGFLNFTLGLGLFQIALAAWIRWKDRMSFSRATVLALLSTLCYFVHLSSWAFVLICACAMTATEWYIRRFPLRNAWPSLAPVFIPSLIFVLLRQPGPDTPLIWRLQPKLVGMVAMLRSYDLIVDAVVAVLVLVALTTAWRCRSEVRLDRAAFVGAIALLIAYVLAPTEALGGSAVDQRFLAASVLLLIPAIQVDTRRPRLSVILAVLVCSSAAIHVAAISARWVGMSAMMSRAIQLSEMLPMHARVYPVFTSSGGIDDRKRQRAFFHAASYAVITRRAFVPTTFAIRGQQPIVFRVDPAFNEDAEFFVGHPAALKGYDYVWFYGASDRMVDVLEACCRLEAREGPFTIWAIRGTGGAGLH